MKNWKNVKDHRPQCFSFDLFDHKTISDFTPYSYTQAFSSISILRINIYNYVVRACKYIYIVMYQSAYKI